MSAPLIFIESGRLVVVPKRHVTRGPMQASCASWSVAAGRLLLVASYVPVHGHPGTAGLKRVAVVPEGTRSSPETLVMLAHAPLLVLGDHSFVYTRTPGVMSEPGRALRACAGANPVANVDVLASRWVVCQFDVGDKLCLYDPNDSRVGLQVYQGPMNPWELP